MNNDEFSESAWLMNVDVYFEWLRNNFILIKLNAKKKISSVSLGDWYMTWKLEAASTIKLEVNLSTITIG